MTRRLLDIIEYDDSKYCIFKLIDNEIKTYGIKLDRIIIAGFGQGGSLALYSSLQFNHTLAGIITLCGCLLDTNIEPKIHRSNQSTLILMVHGTPDDNVPFEDGMYSCIHTFTFLIDSNHFLTLCCSALFSIFSLFSLGLF